MIVINPITLVVKNDQTTIDVIGHKDEINQMDDGHFTSNG